MKMWRITEVSCTRREGGALTVPQRLFFSTRPWTAALSTPSTGPTLLGLAISEITPPYQDPPCENTYRTRRLRRGRPEHVQIHVRAVDKAGQEVQRVSPCEMLACD